LQQHWLPHLSPPRHRAIAQLRESRASTEISSRTKAHKIFKPGDKRRGKQPVVQGPPAKTIVNKPGQTIINKPGRTIINAFNKEIIEQPATTLVNNPAVTLINNEPRGLNSARSAKHSLAQVTSANPMIKKESEGWDISSEATQVNLHGELMTAICGPMSAVSEPVPAAPKPRPAESEPMQAAPEPMPAVPEPMPAAFDFTFTHPARPEPLEASQLSEMLPTPESFSTPQVFLTEKALTDCFGGLPATLEGGAWPGVAALPEVPPTPVQTPEGKRAMMDALMSEFIVEEAYRGYS
jgi:hypothetical protein